MVSFRRLVVWAGQSLLITWVAEKEGLISRGDLWPNNKDNIIQLPFVPVAMKWMKNGRRIIILSVMNVLVQYKVNETGGSSLEEIRRWEGDVEILYCGLVEGDRVEDLVVFAGTTLRGILIWKPCQDGKVAVIHRLQGHQVQSGIKGIG